jgi:predicted ABC-type ATPase
MKDATGHEHEPAGSPQGGQFAAGAGGASAFSSEEKQALKDYAKSGDQLNAGLRESGGLSQSATPATDLYQAPTKTEDELVAESGPGTAAAITDVQARIAGGIATDALVADGGFKNPDGTYTAERQAIHEQILSKTFSPMAIAAATPPAGTAPEMTMLGGRGGSGKSWLTEHGPVDGSKAVLLDADAMKAQLPGYAGWNAALYHEESADLIAMADQRALALRVSVIHDATMKSESGAAKRMADYQSAGYDVNGYYMYASPETATARALSRFSKGGTYKGRFVPPSIILANTQNERNFDKMSKGMKKWAVYDNNKTGGKPRLVARSSDR